MSFKEKLFIVIAAFIVSGAMFMFVASVGFMMFGS